MSTYRRPYRIAAPSVLFLLFLCPGFRPAQAARWQPLPLWGGEVQIAAAPGDARVVYAATPAAGIFRSFDGGESWHFAGHGPQRILGVDPHNFRRLYGVDAGGILSRSIDGGRHWRPINQRLPSYVRAIAFDPQTPGLLYAGTLDGLYRSRNRGDSWSLLAFAARDVQAVAVAPGDPNLLLVATWTFDATSVERSTDGGRSFVPVSPLAASRILFDPVRPGRVYAYGAYGVALLRSDDLGATWTRLGDLSSYDVLAVARTGALLASSPIGGVIRSLDGGETWSPPLDRASQPADNISSLVVLAGRVLAGGTRGVWRSSADGRGWRASSHGLRAHRPRPLAVAPDADSTLYAGAWRGFFISHDSGATFRSYSSRLGYQPYLEHLTIHPRQTQTLYAWGCCAPEGGGVMRTDDGGRHWRAFPSYNGVDRDFLVLAVDPEDTDIVYAGGPMEPHASPCTAVRSTDGGETWTCMTPSGAYDFLDLEFDPRDPRVLTGLFGTGQLYRSEDRGAHWTPVRTGRPGPPIEQIEIDPDRPERLYGHAGYDGVFRSDDGGKTWRRKRPGPGLVRDLLVDPARPGRLYIAVELSHQGQVETTGHVFRSDDAGDHWEEVSGGLPGGVVTDLAADPRGADILYAAMEGQGLYRLRAEP